MRFYNRQHEYYCGIDLHVKTMYVRILDAGGQVLLHRNVPSTPAAFLEQAIYPLREHVPLAGMLRIPARQILARVGAENAEVRHVALAAKVVELLEDRALPDVDIALQLLQVAVISHGAV